MTTLPLPPALVVTVVDDEPMAQDVLVRAARLWRFDCQTASTAEQALELRLLKKSMIADGGDDA